MCIVDAAWSLKYRPSGELRLLLLRLGLCLLSDGLLGRLLSRLVIRLEGPAEAAIRLIARSDGPVERSVAIVVLDGLLSRLVLRVIRKSGIGTARRVNSGLVHRWIVRLRLSVGRLSRRVGIKRASRTLNGLVQRRIVRLGLGIHRLIRGGIVREPGIVAAAVVAVVLPAVVAVVIIPVIPIVSIIPVVSAVSAVSAVSVVSVVSVIPVISIIPVVSIVPVDRPVDGSCVIVSLDPGRGEGPAGIVRAGVVRTSIDARAIDGKITVVGAFAGCAAFPDDQGSYGRA